jgi:uncharacterized protein YdaL
VPVDRRIGLALSLLALAGCGRTELGDAPAQVPELVAFPSVPAPPSPTEAMAHRPGEPLQQGLGVAGAAVTGGLAGTGVSALILYDTTNTWGYLGELYAMYTANLVGHFGAWTAKPVSSYVAGDLGGFTATIYIGSTYDEPIPAAFLADVLSTTKPVFWLYDNIWKLVAQATSATFRATYGWDWLAFTSYANCGIAGRCANVNSVTYKGRSLVRDGVNNQGGIMDYAYFAAPATALATAVRDDNTTLPWAVRSRNLTYFGELPFTYSRESDRMLAFADLLFDVLAPQATTRHRALARIEDIGPDADPVALKQYVDWLYSQKVPFSMAVYPVYKDPLGVYNNSVPKTLYLHSQPSVVSALKYAIARGGTLHMHGYTHQYSNVPDAVNAVSADDFEFYFAHVQNGTSIVMDGPVKEDSAAWAQGRINSGFSEFRAAGFSAPTTFEAPHYAASQADYGVFKQMFTRRYERSLYFYGKLSGGAPDPTRLMGQFFPYSTVDVYGSRIIPENLGDYEPQAYYGYPPRLAADIVAAARANLVVRDGVASFFIHTYDGLPALQQIVTGIQQAGYTFVAANSL